MNMNLELREKRAKAWEAAKNFLDSKRGTDGLLSAEDAATYEKMEADVVALGKEIDRIERADAMDRELSRATSAPLTGKPGSPKPDEKQGRASDEYKRAFWASMRGGNTSELRNALQIGIDSEGGVLAPDEFERKLIDCLNEQNIFRSLCTVIQTSSGDRKIPVVAAHGSAAWVDEGDAVPESDDSFGLVSIGAYKLATMIRVSEELLNDAVFSIDSYIATEFARRIGTKEEESFILGTGTGTPRGFLMDVDGPDSSDPNKITFDEVFDLFYALKAPYRKSATFLMNDSTVKAIRKLKDAQGQYLWSPSVTAGTPDTIMNRPVITSAFMPIIEASKPVIAFGDFKHYWVADRQGRSFKRLNELYAATGQVGFMASQRVDGRLILPEAIRTLTMKDAAPAG